MATSGVFRVEAEVIESERRKLGGRMDDLAGAELAEHGGVLPSGGIGAAVGGAPVNTDGGVCVELRVDERGG